MPLNNFSSLCFSVIVALPSTNTTPENICVPVIELLVSVISNINSSSVVIPSTSFLIENFAKLVLVFVTVTYVWPSVPSIT
jgi:hypothetical protein